MSSRSAVYRAQWVVPVTGSAIRDGAVRVGAGGRIEAVGPATDVAVEDAETVELGRAILLPGLVNVHAHPELTALRGALDGLPFAGWIERIIDLKYRRLGDAALELSTRLGVAEAIAAGITCLAAPDDAGYLAEVMAEVGLRGRVDREVFGPDPAGAERALTGLEEKLDVMWPAGSDRVQIGIAPHAPYTVSRPLFERLAAFAEDRDLPVSIHVAESAAEDAFVRRGSGPFADRLRARGIEVRATGLSPVRWLAETGILQRPPLLVHCVHVDAEDLRLIAESGASIAHCPLSNAKLGHGLAPLAAFLAAGVPVGLGSDSVASNDRIDLLEEARFATLAQRAHLSDPGFLDPARALRLATLGGARALGLEERVGSLEPGKEADLVAVRLGEPHTTPVGDPVATLIHACRASDVCLTVVAGRVLYRDGEYETLDMDALQDRVDGIPAGLRDV